jgi:hypothetical protein
VFYIVSGVAFIVFLFGVGGAFLWSLHTLFNYAMVHLLGRYRFYPMLLWTLSIWTLYFNFFHKMEPFMLMKYLYPSMGHWL